MSQCIEQLGRLARRRGAGTCLVLLGPTASGKTDVSLHLAERMPVEIVSVDSMQVYRGMDIGTAKPAPGVRRRVPHHMIDVVDPEESFSAARFRSMALEAMRGIWARGKLPLLVCGTPLYLKALLWGMFEGPPADPQIRRRLREEAARYGVAHLHARLARVDPDAARRIGPNDLKRIERALEVHELTGIPISRHQAQFNGPPRLGYLAVGLRLNRSALYNRIDRRVEQMMRRGLLGEVTALRDRLGPQASQAVGYKELLAHLRGQVALEGAVQLIKRNTRRLARHQATWFRHFPGVAWVEVAEDASPAQTARQCELGFYSVEHSWTARYDCGDRCVRRAESG